MQGAKITSLVKEASLLHQGTNVDKEKVDSNMQSGFKDSKPGKEVVPVGSQI